MPAPTRDLFDDSTMTFGEHLEILRVHLFKAIIGVVICVIIALFQGDRLIAIMREPIDRALASYGPKIKVDDQGLSQNMDFGGKFWTWIKDQFGFDTEEEAAAAQAAVDTSEAEPVYSEELPVRLNAFELGTQLHTVAPETYAQPPESIKDQTLTLTLASPFFAEWNFARQQLNKPVTFSVQEAFLTYIKVSMIGGLVISSPWVFYQLWMFVAAGLYRHERKFVYIYGALSLLLFLVGVVFCFKLVFPFVLKFLLAFNASLQLQPQIRLSEWISFAVMLPLMFGISFQLPLVMRFLTALSIFTVQTYRDKRRMAILVIAALSMFLTPADPMSMLLMMFPLILLYELGILLCQYSPAQNPFEAESA
jgi:sec-independent protein translocase protein TatC